MIIMTQALMIVIFWNLDFFFFCTENTTFVVLLAFIVLVFARIGNLDDGDFERIAFFNGW